MRIDKDTIRAFALGWIVGVLVAYFLLKGGL